MKNLLLTLLIVGATLPVCAVVTNITDSTRHMSVKDAVDVASNGSIIWVSTGTYVETSISIFQDTLTIQGGYLEDFSAQLDDPLYTIVGTNVSGYVFNVVSNNIHVDISLLTIDGGHSYSAMPMWHSGGGLRVGKSSIVVLSNCVVRNNENGFIFSGGGVYVDNNASLYLYESGLNNNSANLYGGGIFAANNAYIHVRGTEIVGNYSSYGGGIAVAGGTIDIADNCSMFINFGNRNGGAIALTQNSQGILHGTNIQIGAWIFGNFATNNGSGGGIFVVDSSLILSGETCRVGTGIATKNGGGVYLTNSVCTITGGASVGDGISMNTATNFGGGIYAVNSHIYMDQGASVYRSHAGSAGGGIYLSHSTLECDNADIGHDDQSLANTTRGTGGGIYMINSSLTSVNSRIMHNRSNSEGGGIKVVRTNTVYLANTHVCGNIAGFGGAADFYRTVGDMTISGCIISNNTANVMGGALIVGYLNTVHIQEGTLIAGNTAGDSGGGICLFQTASLDISAPGIIPVIFDQNTAANNGGGIYGFSGSSIHGRGNVWLQRNTAKNGGGIYLTNSNCQLVFSNSSFSVPRVSGNVANEDGGGIYLAGSNTYGLIQSTLIGGDGTGNISYKKMGAQGGGGGIAIRSGASIDFINTMIQDNFTSNTGGGLMVREGNTVRFMYDRNKPLLAAVIGNTSQNAGGGIYLNKTSLLHMECYAVVTNNALSASGDGVYSNNTTNYIANSFFAQNGGYGIFIFDAPATRILQSTIAHNTPVGVFASASETVYMTNCIVYGNTISQLWADSEIDIVYSDVQGGDPGTGNIDADPLFQDPGTLNYAISWQSPCTNTGVDLPDVPVDFIGTPRPQSIGWDMGAYEVIFQGVIDVTPYALDFGELLPGETSNLTLIVENTGTKVFSGSVSNLHSPLFTLQGSGAYTLAPSETTNIVFTFSPLTEGYYTNVITCTGGGDINVPLIGTAIPEPACIIVLLLSACGILLRTTRQ